MKRIVYTSNLVRTFLAVALAGMMSACVEDHLYPDVELGADGGLSVYGTVSDGVVVTKAASDADLKEKDLNTLDVFVEHVTNGTGDGTFIARGKYHLPYTNGEAVKEQVDNWLADNWREQGLEEGQKYNVYVAVNNPKTKENVDEVAALKALVSKDETIYKLYNANPGDYRGLTSTKEFMMDGVIKNWTPEPNVAKQVFGKENTTLGNTKLTLNRAAAKFVVNVKFDADFLKSLTKEKKTVEGQEEWVDKPESEQVTITGSPAWTFYNFAFQAPVFTPETQGDGIDVRNSTQRIIHNQSYTGEDKHFQIITYSYPNRWAKADFATAAPSLVVSVGFKDNNGDTNYHYYRIPLVKNSDSDDYGVIERNHIYVVNATIATRGSAAQEDADEIGDVKYKVVNWNDESNSAAIHNEVEAVQHLYLKVNPKVYTLRGDGSQSVDINYLKATGTKVGWKLFAINPTTEEKGEPVESSASNAVWGWFYDMNGKMKTTYDDWTHIGVNISQSGEGTSGSSGKVTVSSTALYNRAIKYMLLRVYLVDNPSLYEDVLIRHFPTDNIQSITGSWSTYRPLNSSSTTVREYSWDPAADGWEAGSYQSELVDVDVDATLADYLAGNAQRQEYEQFDMNSGDFYNYNYYSYRSFWTAAVPQAYRKGADSEANAYGPDDDGYYWWGSGSQNDRWYYDDYDWIQGNGNNRYYRYRNFYVAKYVKKEQRTRYYRDVQKENTGNWVDWEYDQGKTGPAKYVVRSDDPNYGRNDNKFNAHVFLNGTVHNIGSDRNNNAYDDGSEGARYNNNHMYVVQISSTSDKYVLGKPLVGSDYRSQDQVVSPAFMIASQLGIVGTGWNSASAAEHCARYMEVADDRTRYSGWRLPTNDEIEVINSYQRGKFGSITVPEEDRVMAYVLKGSNYFNLSGGTTPITEYTGNDGNFLRCVRDLSAAEVERLNGFDKIVAKYQNK